MRIGPRFNVACAAISISDGRQLQWVDCIRYLGIEVRAARKFTCSIKRAKAAFYRAFNSIYGKIGRIASETVIIELVKIKCLPLLLYAVEACPILTSNVDDLQFALSGVLMKIFDTRSKDIVDTCGSMFGIRSISELIESRVRKFVVNISAQRNSLSYYVSALRY